MHTSRFFILTLLMVPLAVQAADKTRFSLGAYYSTGDYGSTTDTDIESLSLGIRHKHGPWTFKLSVPWLRISGAGNVLPDGQQTAAAATRSRRQGLGDIGVSIGRHLFHDAKGQRGVSLWGKIKLPTADENNGLGTGEMDATIELAPYAVIGKATVFGAIGYRKYGDTATTDYNNVWLGRVGFSHPIAEEQTAGLSMSYRQNTRAGRDDRLSLLVFHTVKWAPGWKLQSYLIKGFTDATADFAAGISLMKEYQ